MLILLLVACDRREEADGDAPISAEPIRDVPVESGSTAAGPAIVAKGQEENAEAASAPLAVVPTRDMANLASAGCSNPVPEDRRFPLPPWPETNFCLHSISYDEIRYGGIPKDRIPAIDEPVFQTVVEAMVWLADVEPVIAFELEGDVRAYPLQVLVWHEIVNDVVAGRPLVVTYCPLCNAALVFERTVDGQILGFGTSGNLRKADLIMYDRQTQSWWQQFTGEAIVGEMTGRQLKLLPSSIVSFGDFRAQFSDGLVLFPDTDVERAYGETPYISYDSLVNPGTKFLDGQPDDRLPPKMRVLALAFEDAAIAYPYSTLEEARVINDTFAGRELAIFWKSGTVSPLYKQVIVDSKDVGSAAAFSRRLDGQLLTFALENDQIVDLETGSSWNLFGLATTGPLEGRRLTPVPANEFLWFAWAAFRPDTGLYQIPQ